MNNEIPPWGETHEALVELWRVYWSVKATDEAMAERYKNRVILPLTRTISGQRAVLQRLGPVVQHLNRG